ATLWTLFTFLTPISAKIGLGYLLLCRILLGVGEGACFPTVNSLISAWFPIEENNKAISTIVFGLVWSILWQIYGKSSPNEYSGISQEELDLILKGKQKNENLSYHGESTTNENDTANSDAPLNNFVNEEDNEFGSEVDALLPKKSMPNSKKIPWKLILSRLEVWAIIITQFCNSFVLPYATQGTVGIIAGVICDYSINKLNIHVRTVRRAAQIIIIQAIYICL
ncbi:11362_t:CDS:2, partial [Racocetra persica]